MTRNRQASTVPPASTLRVLVTASNPASGPVVDANVRLTAVQDRFTGDAVTGNWLPVVCDYIPDWQSWLDEKGRRIFKTDGNYSGVIPHNSGLEAGKVYWGTVVIEDQGGLILTLREEIIVQVLET